MSDDNGRLETLVFAFFFPHPPQSGSLKWARNELSEPFFLMLLAEKFVSGA